VGLNLDGQKAKAYKNSEHFFKRFPNKDINKHEKIVISLKISSMFSSKMPMLNRA
jgi:hypothetical protein